MSSGETRTTSQAYDAQGRLVQLAFDGYRQEVLDYTYVPCPPRPPQVTPTGG